MDSIFFNITDTKFRVTKLSKNSKKIDISNGVILYDINSLTEIEFKSFDRFLMILSNQESKTEIFNQIENKLFIPKSSSTSLFISTKQDISIKSDKLSILLVADFFLKRYLSGDKSDPIDYIYDNFTKNRSLELLDSFATDALTSYLFNKISNAKKEWMVSLKMELIAIELLIHQLSLLTLQKSDEIDIKDSEIAKRAKSIINKNLKDPPTIENLAHLCATNESKLKKSFKELYKTTIGNYIKTQRLHRANILLKEKNLSIKEIAYMVGYKHQGHFSRLFFEQFGIYPKDIKSHF
jgi:AraC-like DNA-binding protein